MAKQKKHKQSTQISPENYIRQRARNLPIYQCWVNKNWRRIGTATVMVVRKHASGNVTVGIYVVDMLCMGVRESMYKYNVPEIRLKMMIDDAPKSGLRFVEVSYRLAHNIVYSAIEYAEKYGFHPTASFTRVSQYILEPDTEKIPLMRIRCGDEKGNPIYMRGEDTDTQTKHVLDRLDQTAGYGNYQYISSRDKNKEEVEDEETVKAHDQYNNMRDSYLAMTDDELKAYFCDIFAILSSPDTPDNEKQEIFIPISILTGVIIKKYGVPATILKYIDMYKKNFDCELISMFDLPNSFFTGLQCHDIRKFARTYRKIVERINPENFEQIIARLHKDYGDLPFVSFIELAYDKTISRDKYLVKLNAFEQKFPDYLMFKIMQYCVNPEFNSKLETLLLERHEPITVIEFAEFLGDYARSCIINSKHPMEKMAAFETMMHEYDEVNHIPLSGLFITISLVKIEIIKNYYQIKDK
jgi:hypothetical protein